MHVAIYNRLSKTGDVEALEELARLLLFMEATMSLYTPIYDQLVKRIALPDNVRCFADHPSLAALRPDFLVTMGGDGTMLDAALLVRHAQIPVVGINLGRLGFLADIEKDRVHHALQAIQQGNYYLEQRTLLQLESTPPIFAQANIALNDCTVLKQDNSSMITIHTYLNGELLNSYWADGLIISTPTGSTGYALSCGGPIVFPQSAAFVITPVAPHQLSVRPIIVSDDSVISLHIEGRSENFLCTLDSRYELITPLHELTIRKAPFTLPLVRLRTNNFLATLKNKLAWGLDTRN